MNWTEEREAEIMERLEKAFAGCEKRGMDHMRFLLAKVDYTRCNKFNNLLYHRDAFAREDGYL